MYNIVTYPRSTPN